MKVLTHASTACLSFYSVLGVLGIACMVRIAALASVHMSEKRDGCQPTSSAWIQQFLQAGLRFAGSTVGVRPADVDAVSCTASFAAGESSVPGRMLHRAAAAACAVGADVWVCIGGSRGSSGCSRENSCVFFLLPAWLLIVQGFDRGIACSCVFCDLCRPLHSALQLVKCA